MSRFDELFSRRLGTLDGHERRRVLRHGVPMAAGRIAYDGRPFVNFSANDYLGLTRHPLLVERAREWAARYGAGSGAARLVTGSLDAHAAIEDRVARLKGTEAALLFNSGWQANASILPALLRQSVLKAEPIVFADALVHASILHGLKAAGITPYLFRHNDLAHLETLLASHGDDAMRRFIVTETVFSMDGDRADVPALAALAVRFDAFLYLDEAHATGVLGPGGAGLSGEAPGGVDLAMGTFSKALGGFGAYVAGSRALCDYLVNAASGFIYATALPPAVLGAIDAVLDLMPSLDPERVHLHGLAEMLRQGLREIGIDCGRSSTQIVPAILGPDRRALAASRYLESRGMLAVAIRPPTVPQGSARLRLALSAAHREEDVARLLDALGAMIQAGEGAR